MFAKSSKRKAVIPDHSSMDVREYIFASITSGILAALWYKGLLFRCITGMTFLQSKLLLAYLVTLFVLLGCFLLFRKNRGGWAVAVSLLLGFGIYTVLAYKKSFGKLITVVMSVVAFLSIIYLMLDLSRPIRKKRIKNRIILRRLHQGYFVTISLIAIGFGTIMVSLGIRGLFGNNIQVSSVKAHPAELVHSEVIHQNMDTILLLQETKWIGLSVQEKLDVMQRVVNIESGYLGMSTELNVGATNQHEGKNLGFYDDRTHTISIVLSHLENDLASEVLNTVLHESYHGYSYRLVDAYEQVDDQSKQLAAYRVAKYYKDELSHYVSGSDGNNNFDDYYNQRCEADAREYAKIAVQDYYDRIENYLSEHADVSGD